VSQKFRFFSKYFHVFPVSSDFDCAKTKERTFQHQLNIMSHDLRKRSSPNTRLKGRWGEEIAARYLIGKKYTLVMSNFYVRGGEIDLIMEKDGIIVFVEVKMRSSPLFGEGGEALTKAKKQHLLRAIFSYLGVSGRDGKTGRNSPSAWRLDLIDIRYEKSSRMAHIRHLPNILEA
jgi:putative endonuclease